MTFPNFEDLSDLFDSIYEKKWIQHLKLLNMYYREPPSSSWSMNFRLIAGSM